MGENLNTKQALDRIRSKGVDVTQWQFYTDLREGRIECTRRRCEKRLGRASFSKRQIDNYIKTSYVSKEGQVRRIGKIHYGKNLKGK